MRDLRKASLVYNARGTGSTPLPHHKEPHMLRGRTLLGLGCLGTLFFLGSTTLVAKTTHYNTPGFFTAVNPCNGELVSIDTDFSALLHQNASGGQTHYVLHVDVQGAGSGDLGNQYRISSAGNAQFDEPSDEGPVNFIFDVPFHREVIGHGRAPNFHIDGVLRVLISKSTGDLSNAFIISATLTCQG
jgi:hypothetical protein